MKKLKTKSTKKKMIAGLFGLAFLGIGAVSSVKASGYIAGWYGDVVMESVVAEENSVPQEDFGTCSEEIYTDAPLTGNVVLMDGVMTRSIYAYDWTIPSNTTYRSVQGYYKTVGGSIRVSPTNHTTHVGIIQPDGTRRYVAGAGVFGHTFSIKQTGTHYIYVENPSSGSIDVGLMVQY